MEKSCRICAPKASPTPIFILVNGPKQPLHARNCLKIWYFERELSKTLKKVNFIFSFESGPFWWTKLSKIRGLELVTSHSSGYKTSSEIFFY